jgi:subtilisin family serine protease
MVQVYPDANLGAAVREIRGLGIESVSGWQKNPFFSRIRLLLTDEEIARFRADLARLPGVFWIDLEPRRGLLNDTTIWVGQSGLSAGQTTPIFTQGIFGQGQTVAIIDTGIDADMCFFRDTTLSLPPTNACNGGTVTDPAQRKVTAVDFLWSTDCAGGISGTEWDSQNHGTHVAGTVAGDNFASPLLHNTADGMAPGAKLVIQDGGFLTDNCGDLPGIGCPVVDLNPLFQQAYTQGARLHTNSWGDNENAAVQNNYSAGSQDVDEFMWNHKDFLIFFAAGNSGPGVATVGTPSTAKSAVSVGATQRSTAANSMAGFSSCGPTDDGRIKPEVTVPGSNIVSAAMTRTSPATTAARGPCPAPAWRPPAPPASPR